MANILIVEDDEPMRVLLGDAVERAGHVAFRCRDWDEAKAALARQAPDLAVLDYMLPGKTGRYIYDQLQLSPATKPVPVLFITGMGRIAEDLPLTRRVKFMRKPLDLKILLFNVRALLELGKA